MPKPVTNYRVRWNAQERRWIVYDGMYRIQSSPNLGVAIHMAISPIAHIVQARLALRRLGAI